MIIIEPIGGLGNRMRSLDSALMLAAQQNRRLRIVWVRNNSLNCAFGDLFELPVGAIDVRELNRFRWSGTLRYGAWRVVCALSSRAYGDQTVYRLKKEGFDFTSVGPGVQRFRTFRSFVPNLRPFERFVPVTALRTHIESYRREHQIGVHIRRTDNAESIRNSPTSEFIARMERELEVNSRTSFFLATDCPQEERVLRDRFPGQVRVHQKSSLDRSTPEAAKDAVVDLYSLANCEKILASFWSSFSDVAAEIRGIEKCVVQKA